MYLKYRLIYIYVQLVLFFNIGTGAGAHSIGENSVKMEQIL